MPLIACSLRQMPLSHPRPAVCVQPRHAGTGHCTGCAYTVGTRVRDSAQRVPTSEVSQDLSGRWAPDMAQRVHTP
eukprot:1488781-Rhodomonas_salina.1